MASNGSFLILFSKSKGVTIEDAAETLADLKGVTTARHEDAVIVSDKSAHMTVVLSTAEHVVQESHEIAMQFANDRMDRDRIAALDARFELTWELEDTMELMNATISVAGALEVLTGGVIFDPVSGTFP
jgi:hypothetical protein